MELIILVTVDYCDPLNVNYLGSSKSHLKKYFSNYYLDYWREIIDLYDWF